MNSPVDQLSAVADMLQFLSNKQGTMHWKKNKNSTEQKNNVFIMKFTGILKEFQHPLKCH